MRSQRHLRASGDLDQSFNMGNQESFWFYGSPNPYTEGEIIREGAPLITGLRELFFLFEQ